MGIFRFLWIRVRCGVRTWVWFIGIGVWCRIWIIRVFRFVRVRIIRFIGLIRRLF